MQIAYTIFRLNLNSPFDKLLKTHLFDLHSSDEVVERRLQKHILVK